MIITDSRLKKIIKEEVEVVMLHEAGIPFPESDYKKHDIYNMLSSGGVDVSSDSDIAALKKAFRKSSMNGEYRHPDLGGDTILNSLLTRAYATLQTDKDGYDRSKHGSLTALRKRIRVNIMKKYGDILSRATRKPVNEISTI